MLWDGQTSFAELQPPDMSCKQRNNYKHFDYVWQMNCSKLLSLGDVALCISQTLLLQLCTVKACITLSEEQKDNN